MRCHWSYLLSVLSAVALADRATSLPSLWGDIRVKHTWDTLPTNWESLGPPPAGTAIDLYIALKPHSENALIEALYKVSDPGHEKHVVLTTPPLVLVAELVAPRQDTLKLVHSWLEHHGVPSSSISTSHGGGWLTITSVPVSQADELLSASYQLYRHTGANATEVILRTVSYALPAVLHGHVQTVAPTTFFAPPYKLLQTLRQHPSEGAAAAVVNATSRDPVRVLPRTDNFDVTPSFLRWLYRTQGYVPVAMVATFTVQQINGGGFDPNQLGSEANADIQYAAAMTYPTLHIFYSTGGRMEWVASRPAPHDTYLVWLNYLLHQEDIPPTISISYACTLFGQLGLRGVSILVSSGDDGVGSIEDCMANSASARFVPMFPASYMSLVTSVGGTVSYNPEVGMYLSGGGFSVHFTRPIYQEDVVPPFLGYLGNQYAGLYNPQGRGIPDISAQASRFKYILNADQRLASGTSMATPIVAGIISLLNDHLISTGRHTLGFLNLLLYDHGRYGINDITSGSNPGCGTDGFTAIPGWDPVTGMGTPDFTTLQHIIDLLIPV
ncbi:subtilisin-like protein [Lactarius deliciosus]|nr:subtilisin-like protein [Lactarius deliciosus]